MMMGEGPTIVKQLAARLRPVDHVVPELGHLVLVLRQITGAAGIAWRWGSRRRSTGWCT